MFRAVFGALLVVCLNTPAHAGKVFVVSKAKKDLEVYNSEDGKQLFTIKGPKLGTPHVVAVSPDGRHAYIGDAEGTTNTLTVVDVEKQAIEQTMPLVKLMKPHGLVLAHDGSKLFATCAPNRCVIEIDLASMKVTRRFPFMVDSVENLAITPDDKFIIASSGFDGTCPVIDLTKGEMERMILTGDGPEGVTVTPDGKEVWVANRVAQTLAVIDFATRHRTALIQCIGNPMHVYFTNDGSQAIVTLAVGDRLAIFDRAKHVELARFEVGDFPVEMAFGDTDKIAYVANGEGGDVAVVDLPGHKVIRRFAVGAQPEGIAYSK
jgi:YVTN family beta-propeller protein